MTMRFAMNRTCTPQASLADFIRLATDAGVGAVEIRNDIEGQEFANGMEASDLRHRLSDAGLAVASVNALQRFNEWTAEREAEAIGLVRYTAALGAPGLVLCPLHNADHGWSDAEAEANLRDGLRKLRPILLDHGVKGYVEPLGMSGSTMKQQAMAVAAVEDVGGWDAYQLCHDTFQFYRCGDRKLFPDHIGLAHMSGIARTDLAPQALTEPDRGFVFEGDQVGNIAQLQALKAAGYAGFVSMEPFSPATQQDPHILTRLRESLDLVGKAVGIDR